jgi:cellulose synthase (UDP-forming)
MWPEQQRTGPLRLLPRLRRWLARLLEVEVPAPARTWIWRLFVRPAPQRPGRAARWLDAALERLAVALSVEEPGRPRQWGLRLLLAPAAQTEPAGSAFERVVRGLITGWLRLVALPPRVDHEVLGRWLESAADARVLAPRPVKAAGLLVCALGFWLAITTPMDWVSQSLFTLAICVLAIQIRNTPGTIPTLLLIALATVASCRYGWWRITQSMDLEPGWETALGWTLLAAEFYAWLVMMFGFAQCAWPLRRRPGQLPEHRQDWPTVDVLIPTINEPLSVLRPTVLAAKGMDWPPGKLRIHLLDDGRREPVRRFAQMAGIDYLSRPDNAHAKAGNLNYALARTQGEYVAIFDCDHLPVRSFLTTTIGCMIRDPLCALVQTPHHFFSPDPFERNLETFRRIPNEGSLFYGLVQDGNDFWNSTFFCGSSAVLRREALMRIGGVATDTVTEDAHTALRLHRHGYRSAYLNLTQAAGLATESLAQMVKQRIRWARGMAQIFRIDNPLLGKGLSLMQRLCYSNAMLHFFYGIPRLVFLTAPLAYLFFELHIIRASASIFALYLIPHLVLPHITSARMQTAYRHSFWAEVYETALAWYVAWPTTLAFLNPRLGKFNVTAKNGLVQRARFDWLTSLPYLGLVLLNGTGFSLGIVRLVAWNRFEAGTVVLNLLWTFFNLMMLGAAIGVAHERRQVRGFHRVAARIPVTLVLPDGSTHRCFSTDYSLSGLGVRLDEPLDLPGATPVRVVLESGDGEHSFGAKVTGARGLDVGLHFDYQNLGQQQQLIACTFGRPDAWVRWHEQYATDLPLRGFSEIVTLGLKGYADLLRSTGRASRRRLAAWRRAVEPAAGV